jgi:hypothetical protein
LGYVGTVNHLLIKIIPSLDGRDRATTRASGLLIQKEGPDVKNPSIKAVISVNFCHLCHIRETCWGGGKIEWGLLNYSKGKSERRAYI